MSDINDKYLLAYPELVLKLGLHELLAILGDRYGADSVRRALDPKEDIPGPYVRNTDTNWMKTANTVGINVRTIGTFWHIIPYTLTLPDAQNAIHILPIWEPGVVASLYGPSSWHINPEFYHPGLAAAFPQLSGVESQLKSVVNLLHLMGKAVGMDVVPHTDRYSEMVIANPGLFEWLQRRGLEILRHDSAVFETATEAIFSCLKEMGTADTSLPELPDKPDVFFYGWSEKDRLRALFGTPEDYQGRLARRKLFVQVLYDKGLETVPATMGPPYRGLEVDPDPEAQVTDEEGRVWHDYRISHPQPMSRVFGPLARYKMYESRDENRHWELDFDRPYKPSWDYVCRHYARIQSQYGFDFMRGDMSHVQMRPDGVPDQPGAWYDLHRAVKEHIARNLPSFAYFAESFLADPGEMAYGDECDHLEASLADSTLGNLQSEPVGTPEFMRNFFRYRRWLETRCFAPNFTIMTADKDDPRFDGFYLEANELRHFMALFLTDMPSYMALGFECRDPHPVPAPNEFYTKLYVFHLPDGPKGTHGPWKWGQNQLLYQRLCRQKEFAQKTWHEIGNLGIQWVAPPVEDGSRKVIAWTSGPYLFFANLSAESAGRIIISNQIEPAEWLPCFSTHRASFQENLVFEGGCTCLESIQSWEGLVFMRTQG